MPPERPRKPLTPRKRPAQRRSATTVDAIIEAAARILESAGLAGYNTNDIARLAGISVGSLYQYFPNKEAITNTLILREMTALLDAASRIPAEAPGLDRLARLIEIAAEHQFRRPALARLLDIEEERLPDEGDLADVRTALSAIIRDSIATVPGALADPDHAVTDIVAIIKGLVDTASRRGETDMADVTRRTARAVFGYLLYR